MIGHALLAALAAKACERCRSVEVITPASFCRHAGSASPVVGGHAVVPALDAHDRPVNVLVSTPAAWHDPERVKLLVDGRLSRSVRPTRSFRAVLPSGMSVPSPALSMLADAFRRGRHQCGQLPEPVEEAAYYIVSEALTNAAKHAKAPRAAVHVESVTGALRISVRDDGCGGTSFTRGTGLVGLQDRVEALGGQISLHSPPDTGTTLCAELPVTNAGVVAWADSRTGA
jgi:hypothetical protein